MARIGTVLGHAVGTGSCVLRILVRSVGGAATQMLPRTRTDPQCVHMLLPIPWETCHPVIHHPLPAPRLFLGLNRWSYRHRNLASENTPRWQQHPSRDQKAWPNTLTTNLLLASHIFQNAATFTTYYDDDDDYHHYCSYPHMITG